MLVYEEMANDLHRELSRLEKSRHFVYVLTLITRKICPVKMSNAKLKNHLKS